MAGMEWFRMYYEARTDKKLATLTDAEHRVWSDLLCFAAEQTGRRGTIPPMEVYLLAIECARGDADLLAATIDRLVKLKIVTHDDDGTITFINFEKRQYDKPSDTPAATAQRKRDERERARRARDTTDLTEYVTPVSRDIPAQSRAVTRSHATDTDTDTDTEGVTPPIPPTPIEPAASATPTMAPKYTPAFERFWHEYPRGNGRAWIKADAYAEWKRLRPDGDMADLILSSVVAWKAGRDWQQGHIHRPDRWLKGRAFEECPEPYQAVGEQSARASPNGRHDPVGAVIPAVPTSLYTREQAAERRRQIINGEPFV